MISVIVPVYNTEKYLDRCIQSILSQIYTDFELLLIDDGSTDSSGVICDRYAELDSRVRVFHKKNGGASSARNMGLDNARGEFIGFVDADDYVLPEFLSNFIDISNGEDILIQGIIPDYSISSEYIIKKASIDYSGNIQDWLIDLSGCGCEMFGALWNKLFKRSIIVSNKLRLNETISFLEDEEFLLRYLTLSKTVCSISKSGYVYLVPNWEKYNGAENLPVINSMYRSVVLIFESANLVTDFYQTQLLEEWLSVFRKNSSSAIKFTPELCMSLGRRMFRIAPLKAVFQKIFSFVRKR